MSHIQEIPPDILDRIDPEVFSVSNLIGLAIVERGGPMTIEEIAERLAGLGVFRSVPSLRKTWHALRCLRKNGEGKLELMRDRTKYSPWEDLCLRVHLHLQARGKESQAVPSPGKPAVNDASPVTLEEVLLLPWSALPQGLSPRRKLALLVEACGGTAGVERAVELIEKCGQFLFPG